MYGLMVVISILVRQFCLPNPFECFGNMAEIYNCIAGVLISPLSYRLVGLIYHTGDCPPLGSFLYLIVYAAITGILALMGIFSFAWWWVLIIVVAMIAICVLLAKLRRWLDGTTW